MSLELFIHYDRADARAARNEIERLAAGRGIRVGPLLERLDAVNADLPPDVIANVEILFGGGTVVALDVWADAEHLVQLGDISP